MTVAPHPPFSLTLSIAGDATTSAAHLSLFGTTGQRQVVQVSSNLAEWVPLTTNLAATNLFRVTETDTLQHATRFYRAVVEP